MKIVLTNDIEKFLDGRYPCLRKASEIIYEMAGVSLDEMRSDKRLSVYTEARMLFFALCENEVFPTYYIASYLNRDHASATHWKNLFCNRMDVDEYFKDFYLKLREEFFKR